MEAVILVIHLIIAISIICIVLIQPSEAGGFMGTGSMSNMMAPRRTADVLTRATTILAGCFFVTSLILAVMAGSRPAETSILDADQPAAVTTDAVKVDQKTAPEPKAPATPKAPVSK